MKAKLTELGLDVATPEQQTPAGTRGLSQSRGREVVADHQGGGREGGVSLESLAKITFFSSG